MKINRICPMCGNENTINIPDKVVPMLNAYNAGYGYIQDLPLSATEREFIKTGFCSDCQDIIFCEPEEDE